jgi:hypothetical protein
MMISGGNPKRYWEEIMLMYHFLHHESHMRSPGIDTQAPLGDVRADSLR